MLPYADLATVSFIRTIIPQAYTVIWWPPESSRQGLAQSTSQESIGLPGVTVFRTACRRYDEGFTRPQAGLGYNLGERVEHTKNLAQMHVVRATYTSMAWAKDLSDLNTIEREFWYADIYKALSYTIQEHVMKFGIWSEGMDYGRVIQEKSGKVLWYNFTKTFSVDTFWTKSKDLPTAEEINVIYKHVTGGNPVVKVVLESFVIS